ncbi:protein Mabiki [Drosophila willistoni]|uniref:protein Mabiki n=1 Tax=Drosophila willistoni TaxID=7260 RepID=UPI001F088430|nr:protein Mabiki [Drosophila willistoni]
MDNYTHKKFTGALKRKRGQNEDSDDEDVIFITKESPQPLAKRQRKLFRPWLDNDTETQDKASPPPTPPVTTATTYHANMVRAHISSRQRSPQEQLRRDRNTLASLRHRRSKQQQQLQLEQQYAASRRQHEVNLEQQIRLSLYYVRFLQQTLAQSHPIDASELKGVPQHLAQHKSSLQKS